MKWILFAVQYASKTEAGVDPAQVETALEFGPSDRRTEIMPALWSRSDGRVLQICATAFGLLVAASPLALAVELTIAQSTDAVSLDPAFRADTATGNVSATFSMRSCSAGPT